jgi:hypothetical protein
MFLGHTRRRHANHRRQRCAGAGTTLPCSWLLLALLAGLTVRGHSANAQTPVSAGAGDPQTAGADSILRLPPVDSAPDPLPVAPVAELSLQPRSDSLLDESQRANPELVRSASQGYGSAYGDGLQVSFWGWLSYLSVPQQKMNTFYAWETELDVTKSFSENISASADIDFTDSNNGAEQFTRSGSAIVHVEQLFLSVMLPDKNETIVTAGKFNSPFGIERRDFWDRVTGSTSLLFDVQPEDLVGIMVTHPVPCLNMVLRPFVVNGFNQNLDVNQQPSLGLMIEQKPCPCLSLAVTNWWGPEFSNDNHDILYFLEAKATWHSGPASLASEVLYARTTTDEVEWWRGAAVIGSYDLNDRVRLFSQWSWLDDPFGLATSSPQLTHQVSAGLAYYLHPHVELRFEYRHDFRSASTDAEYASQFDGGKNIDMISAHATFGY